MFSWWWTLTCWPLRDVEVYFSYSFYELISSVLCVKLILNEWHRSSFMKRSTLVKVMAWCRQAISNYLSQCWSRSVSPYGHSELTTCIIWLPMASQAMIWIANTYICFPSNQFSILRVMWSSVSEASKKWHEYSVKWNDSLHSQNCQYWHWLCHRESVDCYTVIAWWQWNSQHSAGYETWPPIGWIHCFVISWSKYWLQWPPLKWIVSWHDW